MQTTTPTSLALPYRQLSRHELPEELAMLEAKALEAAQGAYAPYSHFSVGAALLLENGEVVAASNQENAAYPSGTCAERTALFYAGARYPDQAPTALVVVAIGPHGRTKRISPCGACRQVMLETTTRYHRPYQVLLAGAEELLLLDDARLLLPFGFDGDEL